MIDDIPILDNITTGDIFVIGGQKIYEEALKHPKLDKIFLRSTSRINLLFLLYGTIIGSFIL